MPLDRPRQQNWSISCKYTSCTTTFVVVHNLLWTCFGLSVDYELSYISQVTREGQTRSALVEKLSWCHEKPFHDCLWVAPAITSRAFLLRRETRPRPYSQRGGRANIKQVREDKTASVSIFPPTLIGPSFDNGRSEAVALVLVAVCGAFANWTAPSLHWTLAVAARGWSKQRIAVWEYAWPWARYGYTV